MVSYAQPPHLHSVNDPEQHENALLHWFHGSALIASDGSPQVFYHGTNYRFRAFDPGTQGQHDDGYFGRGFYFAPDTETAEGFGGIVLPVYLRMRNPFILPSSGSCDHPCLLDLRDRLAALKGMPSDLRPNRRIPPGFEMRWVDRENRYDPRNQLHLCYLGPTPQFYGTDREIYGPERDTEEKAIVAFNDQIAGANYDDGWAEHLLKALGRRTFHQVLLANGHDGIIVENPDFGREEFIVFNPGQIKHATQNCGRFDPDDPDIYA